MKYLKRLASIIGLGLGLALAGTAFAQTPTPISTPSVAPLILPMKPGAWQQHYNSPTTAYALAGPLKLLPDGSGLTEMFPTKAAGIRYNYLVSPQGGRNINKYHYLQMTVGVTTEMGTPFFEYLSPTNQCRVGCDPVSARPMIWGPPGGDVTSTTNRWWATAMMAVPLAPGKFTITIPLDGANWTGVLGQSGKGSAFAAAKANVYALCITFGGGWYYGHGTDTAPVKGTLPPAKASFQLYDYRLY